MPKQASWQIAVDTGGTFTDCLACDPDGILSRTKVLSTGCLRLPIADRPSADELILGCPGFPDDFLVGWRVSAAGTAQANGAHGVSRAQEETGAIAQSLGPRLQLTEPWRAAGRISEIELSTGEEAAVVAVRIATETPLGQDFPPVSLRLATTRGTNALLERRGSPVTLVTTRGFADLLEIGTQQRPDLFALEVRKPPPLYTDVLEVEERIAADGAVVRTLHRERTETEARALVANGHTAAAVALLHSFLEPKHELVVGEILRAAGFRHVSLSSELSSRIKIVPRAQTAVIDAYLAEILRSYLSGVRETLAASSVHVMTSAGALVPASVFQAKDSLLSGPAGGVLGAGSAARGLKNDAIRIISFDMGGTSTDVSRFDGTPSVRAETRVAGVTLLSPSIAIETVAAGGGSICRFDGTQLKVGPESAGADPGPACYGRGGPLTLTDVNLLLGRLVPDRFPFRAHPEAARGRAHQVGVDAGHANPAADQIDGLLAGFLTIADERMAGAIRRISVREGYDPSLYALVAFGGAGAQHACGLAKLLGMHRILVPADGALLSAAGLATADLAELREHQVLRSLADCVLELGALFGRLGTDAKEALHAQGASERDLSTGRASLFLRYQGQESTLDVEWTEEATEETLSKAFEDRHERLYGYVPAGRAIEVESVRLALRALAPDFRHDAERVSHASLDPTPLRTQPFFDAIGWSEVPVFERGDLPLGFLLRGPCLVAESNTVTVIERSWTAAVHASGGLVLERAVRDK